MIAVGIDPGATGAIAWLVEGEARGVLLDTGDATAVWAVLHDLKETLARIHVGIEKVNAWPKMGSMAAFHYGGAFAVPQAVCVALGLPFSFVNSESWNRVAFEARARPQDKAERKRAALRAARERWPAAPLARMKDGAIAEALWMALFVARREGGEVSGGR